MKTSVPPPSNDSASIPCTVTGLLDRARELWPHRSYLQTRVGHTMITLTYAEVAAHVETFARALAESGIRSGDRVALLSENRPAWVIAYLAILRTGATVVPVDSLMSPREIEHVLEMARVRLLIASSRFDEMLRSTTPERPHDFATRLLDDPVTTPAASLLHAGRIALPHPHPSDAAVIIFTSGTTGFSKGVVLTHQNLCSDVRAMADANVIRPNDNFLLLLPLHHTFSSTVNMLGALALGAAATFATSYKSRDIVDDARVARVTMLVAVPQVFENLMIGMKRAVGDAPRGTRMLFRILLAVSTRLGRYGIRAGRWFFASLRRKSGLGSLRLMISGGAALPPEINRFFECLGFTLLQGYGLTETSPVLSVNLPQQNRIGSSGRALPGVELRIESPDADGIGEICARGPMIMQGYFENPSATAESLRNGWFHTGDAGYLDRAGFLYVTGRLKSMIVTSGGKNIYPEEIEMQLNLSPCVSESLVLATGRERGGEELTAILVPNNAHVEAERAQGREVDVNAELAAVVEHYNQSVPAYRRIRQWRVQEGELEKTSTRKVRRYLYRSGGASPGA